MPERKRPKRMRPSAKIKVDFLIPIVPERKLQMLLRLLRDEARRIFDQRWVIAWTGEKVYELGDTVKTRPK